MQNSPFPLSINNRLPYPMMSSAASSPFAFFADQSTVPFSFPSKPVPTLSRQSSMEASYVALFSSSVPSLSRQVSLVNFPDAFDVDPFNFPSFDGSVDFTKAADVEAFDLTSRVSSFDSEMSGSWSSIASDDSGSAPRSPQSSVDSLSDSSQSDDADHFSAYTSSPAYPVQEHWVQPHFQRQATSLPVKTAEPLVTSRLPASPVPVLPLPFNPPVYAFNYHSAEDEPTPQPSSSRNERREGLRGGGDSRQELQRSFLHLQDSEGDNSRALYSASAASQPPMASSAAPSDAISPKSLLLSLSRTAASTPSSHASHHQHAHHALSQHYSPSSSSSASSNSVTSIQLMGQQDPNEVVVGIYTRAERAAKIARYREKRANRQWRKKILYGCRKSFADNRPRVGGRFIKMKPTEGEEKDTRRGAK